MRDNLIRIDNTKFIFKTNFSGDPSMDSYGSKTRKACVLIPSYEQAMDLMERGVKVRETRPRPGEEEGFVPRYYTSVIVNYDSEVAQSRPPKVYLVSGDNPPVLLDKDTVGNLDHVYVLNVNVVFEVSFNKRYNKTLCYIRTMYVEQDIDVDPYANLYNRNY